MVRMEAIIPIKFQIHPAQHPRPEVLLVPEISTSKYMEHTWTRVEKDLLEDSNPKIEEKQLPGMIPKDSLFRSPTGMVPSMAKNPSAFDGSLFRKRFVLLPRFLGPTGYR